MFRRLSKSIIGRRFITHWKLSVISMITVILVAIGAVTAVTSMLGAAAEIPVRAVECVIQIIFGNSCGDGGPGDSPDEQTTGSLTSCIGADRDQLTAMLSTVPANTDPALAYAWLLYTRAHTAPANTTSTAASSSTTGVATTPAPRSGQVTFQDFAQRWPATPVDPAQVPQMLQQSDPTIDYQPDIPTATAALLQLSNTHTITLTSDQSSTLASTMAHQCLSDTTNSSSSSDSPSLGDDTTTPPS